MRLVLESYLTLDIVVFNETVNTIEMLEISDLLDRKLGNTIECTDTVLTISDAESTIEDDILHYLVNIKYAYIVDEIYNKKNGTEYMEKLELKGV